jgi:Tfp pilus assembly protein PilF
MRCFKLFLIMLLILTAAATHAQEPVSADDFSQRGISRFEKNDFDGAIADFTKAIELHGHQVEFCYYFRGIALYRRGRIDEAIVDISKAITLKQHPRFYNDRGNMLAQQGDYEHGLNDLNRAIELDPKFAKAYGDRGIVRLMRGEDTAAELDFAKCFELNKTLEFQFKAAAQQIRQQAVLRAEHQTPADVEIVKFSWNEGPIQVLNIPSSPVIAAQTTPLSQSGLRVLGGSGEKGEPGPAILPDRSSPILPDSPKPETRIQGIEQTFTASIRNTGNKTITNVRWAYFFVPQDPKDTFVYVFTTKINIPPGKEKNLRDQVTSLVLQTAPGKAPTTHNRAQFKERVVILRLDYSDGSSWQSMQ